MTPDVEAYAAGIRAGQRHLLSRALTLVESARPADRAAAGRLLELLGPGGTAHRVGISGVPGGGKSTLIDALGRHLLAAGHRVAVLAVDPSSRRTNGSILGDRTRMAGLGAHHEAFIRPSPSAGALGGGADSTHDVLTVVEAAGYDVILVETVGTGQSETAVADLVDTFLLVAVTGTGDELQAIKMGVLEWADVVAVTKADGPNTAAARSAARRLAGALRQAHGGAGQPPPDVLTCSAVEHTGIAELWAALRDHHERGRAGGALEERRRERRVARLRARVRAELLRPLAGDPTVAAVEDEVRRGARTADEGADLIVAAVRRRMTRSD